MKLSFQEPYTRNILFLLTVILFSCKSTKPVMIIPDSFATNAVSMPVKGIGKDGSQTRKPIFFGSYASSKIKRGWNISTSKFGSEMRSYLEERILRVVDITWRDASTTERDRFQFEIQNGSSFATVFASEMSIHKYTDIGLNGRLPTDISILRDGNYSFSAAIVTSNKSIDKPWQLALNAYKNPSQKQGGSFFEKNSWDETGFLTNGEDTIQLQVIKPREVLNNKGSKVTMPFAMMKAYHFIEANKLLAIVDTYGQVIWMHKELSNERGFLIASAAAAILLRKITAF